MTITFALRTPWRVAIWSSHGEFNRLLLEFLLTRTIKKKLNPMEFCLVVGVFVLKRIQVKLIITAVHGFQALVCVLECESRSDFDPGLGQTNAVTVPPHMLQKNNKKSWAAITLQEKHHSLIKELIVLTWFEVVMTDWEDRSMVHTA